MLLLKPVTIETIAMTVATPTTMPRIVRLARSLCARTASSAKRTFSPKPRRRVAENAHESRAISYSSTLQSGRGATPSRPGTARRRSRPTSRRARPTRTAQSGVSAGSASKARLTSAGTATPDHDADRPAQERQRRRLGQELQDDVAPERADGLAHPDLARPLRHRHEHDVHHADAADQERDEGDEDHRAA